MKKLRELSVLFVTVVLLSVSVFSSSAITTFKDGHYVYTYVGENEFALYDWDDETSGELIVKSTYGGRPITSIYDFAFMNNNFISSVDFSQASNLKNINTSAFDHCTALSKEVVLPQSLENIGMCAFQLCTLLPGVKIPEKVKTIPYQCFYRCDSLSSVELPEALETIEPRAFEGCHSLKNIYIPNSVTSIGNYAFKDSENVVINCNTDSYAHEYAEQNNIPYILLDAPVKYELGDVNLDGVLNIVDATVIQQYVAELISFDETQLSIADVNHDGEYDILDATEIQIIINE